MTSASIPNRILYPYEEAAELLGLPSAQALRDLVCRKRGPVLTREGRRVFFNVQDLHDWADARRELPRAPESATSASERPKRRRGRPTVADRQAARQE